MHLFEGDWVRLRGNNANMGKMYPSDQVHLAPKFKYRIDTFKSYHVVDDS